MKYDFIIQGPTAKQLEDDGYFMNVSKYAKLFGIQPKVRITTGVNNLLAQLSGDDQGFDEWHDELDSLLTCFKEMIINLSENKLRYFEEKGVLETMDFKHNKLFCQKDFTSGDAIHIFLPSEY
tara:strand:+ start:657 stop:1025 length:369 start_codon:yes stop_codon:yes gene_type:complete